LSRYRLQPRLTALLLLFILGVITVLFVQLPGSSLLWRELQNTGHTLLFSIMTLAFMAILRGILPVADNKTLTRYTVAAAVLVAVAVFSELGQLLTHREPSLIDIVRDIAGILIGLGLYASIDRHFLVLWRQHGYLLRIGALILSFCLLLVSVLPLLHLAYAYVQRNEAFPVIIDFQAAWARSFLHLNRAVLTQGVVPDAETSGIEHIGQQRVPWLKFNLGIYPGVSIIEPYSDWSAYKVLTLDMYSLQTHAFSLVLRIHDTQHTQAYSDRFNQVLTVMPGNNRFRIPLLSVQYAPVDRDMDMANISNVALFVMNIDGPVNLYPGILSLE